MRAEEVGLGSPNPGVRDEQVSRAEMKRRKDEAEHRGEDRGEAGES